MNDSPQPPKESNTLGKASLVLGILASILLFFVGACAGVGKQQGWLKNVENVLGVFGATFAFMGLLAVALGFFGLFGRNRSRISAIVGLVLGLSTLLLFAAILQNVQ